MTWMNADNPEWGQKAWAILRDQGITEAVRRSTHMRKLYRHGGTAASGQKADRSGESKSSRSSCYPVKTPVSIRSAASRCRRTPYRTLCRYEVVYGQDVVTTFFGEDGFDAHAYGGFFLRHV